MPHKGEVAGQGPMTNITLPTPLRTVWPATPPGPSPHPPRRPGANPLCPAAGYGSLLLVAAPAQPWCRGPSLCPRRVPRGARLPCAAPCARRRVRRLAACRCPLGGAPCARPRARRLATCRCPLCGAPVSGPACGASPPAAAPAQPWCRGPEPVPASGPSRRAAALRSALCPAPRAAPRRLPLPPGRYPRLRPRPALSPLRHGPPGPARAVGRPPAGPAEGPWLRLHVRAYDSEDWHRARARHRHVTARPRAWTICPSPDVHRHVRRVRVVDDQVARAHVPDRDARQQPPLLLRRPRYRPARRAHALCVSPSSRTSPGPPRPTRTACRSAPSRTRWPSGPAARPPGRCPSGHRSPARPSATAAAPAAPARAAARAPRPPAGTPASPRRRSSPGCASWPSPGPPGAAPAGSTRCRRRACTSEVRLPLLQLGQQVTRGLQPLDETAGAVQEQLRVVGEHEPGLVRYAAVAVLGAGRRAARCLSCSIRAWPATMACDSRATSADCFSARSSARLYASVAAAACRYRSSIWVRTCSRLRPGCRGCSAAPERLGAGTGAARGRGRDQGREHGQGAHRGRPRRRRDGDVGSQAPPPGSDQPLRSDLPSVT